jgi:hypothetical protein
MKSLPLLADIFFSLSFRFFAADASEPSGEIMKKDDSGYQSQLAAFRQEDYEKA